MNTVRIATLGVACAALLVPAALAAHGKVGTWEVSTKMSGGAMAGMPDMSKLPPAVQAQMKACGVSMNAGGGMTVKFCMTADQVNTDKPPMSHRDNCETQNVKMQGNIFSADVVCKGPGAAKGHDDDHGRPDPDARDAARRPLAVARLHSQTLNLSLNFPPPRSTHRDRS
jgi:hypothetical protein